MIEYTRVTDINELNSLEGKSALYNNLRFEFSDTYISDLKQQLDAQNAFQLLAFSHNDVIGYVASAETLFPEY